MTEIKLPVKCDIGETQRNLETNRCFAECPYGKMHGRTEGERVLSPDYSFENICMSDGYRNLRLNEITEPLTEFLGKIESNLENFASRIGIFRV